MIIEQKFDTIMITIVYLGLNYTIFKSNVIKTEDKKMRKMRKVTSNKKYVNQNYIIHYTECVQIIFSISDESNIQTPLNNHFKLVHPPGTPCIHMPMYEWNTKTS